MIFGKGRGGGEKRCGEIKLLAGPSNFYFFP
jgi:hypothetical protein